MTGDVGGDRRDLVARRDLVMNIMAVLGHTSGCRDRPPRPSGPPRDKFILRHSSSRPSVLASSSGGLLGVGLRRSFGVGFMLPRPPVTAYNAVDPANALSGPRGTVSAAHRSHGQLIRHRVVFGPSTPSPPVPPAGPDRRSPSELGSEPVTDPTPPRPNSSEPAPEPTRPRARSMVRGGPSPDLFALPAPEPAEPPAAAFGPRPPRGRWRLRRPCTCPPS